MFQLFFLLLHPVNRKQKETKYKLCKRKKQIEQVETSLFLGASLFFAAELLVSREKLTIY